MRPYDRPNLSKDYLAGNAPEEWIPLRPPEFYRGAADRHASGARARRIDRKARASSSSEAGRRLRFDALLLATGAEPIRLPIPGADGRRCTTCARSPTAGRSSRAAGKAQRAVVIGASFIGLEVAASLRARGLEVHVVAPDALPLERVLGAEIGRFIQALHEEHGVVFHLGQKPAAIDGGAVRLESGERVEADLVVVGIGVRPRLELAETAGLAHGPRRPGERDFWRPASPASLPPATSRAGPTRGRGKPIRVEHWVVAERQGQTAARNMLGRRERFDQIPFFWSMHFGLEVDYTGHAEKWDAIDVSGDVAAKDAQVIYREQGRVAAIATVLAMGSPSAVARQRQNLQAEAAMEQGADAAAAVGATH